METMIILTVINKLLTTMVSYYFSARHDVGNDEDVDNDDDFDGQDLDNDDDDNDN